MVIDDTMWSKLEIFWVLALVVFDATEDELFFEISVMIDKFKTFIMNKFHLRLQ